MAIPSGSGSEILKRVQSNGNSNTQVNILTVDTLHIVTVLSIVICNIPATNHTFDILVSPGGSGACFLMPTTSISGASSFVWNDRLVMTAADILKISSTSTDFELYVSYIDQNWEN